MNDEPKTLEEAIEAIHDLKAWLVARNEECYKANAEIDALLAEIARLKAREVEMRKPLSEIVNLCQEMSYSTMCPAADLIRHIGNVGRIEQLARALLAIKEDGK
jgi:septal ring factor EnvC (AmiA/AmiB activator)